MKNLRLLPILLAGVGLTLSACETKSSDGDGDTVIGDDENDDAEEEDSSSDSATSFGSSEDTGESADESETCSFLNCNQSDMPSIASCDPFAQDCPEGEKCVAYASAGGTWDANKCVMVMGDGQPGDPCTYADAVTSTDDCAANSWCWDVNAEGMGVCTSFCTGSADAPLCEMQMTSCSIANNGSINLCLTNCDPLLQDCSDGQACFFDGGNFVCANATQDIPTGEPCGFINDCAAGNVCLGAESFPSCGGSACCGAFCDLTDPTCTLPDTECVAFYEEGTAPPGYEDVGVCVLPG
ncbi:MAG: ribulose phosphate epimerase [Deltaproteobacteria bacterium]|nr:ribulose phosphate epimerase [Deltaproteobacteria bacterium]